MDRSRLPRKAYNMLFELDSRGHVNWVTNIRRCLQENGFGDVWQFQGAGNLNTFLYAFRQRLIDVKWQAWHAHISTSDRFDSYRNFTSTHLLKPYLLVDLDRNLKHLLAKFRFGASDILTHKNRYKAQDNNDSSCPLCRETEETEVHFVLTCPALQDIRTNFIPAKYFRQPNYFHLCLLLSSTIPDTVKNLSLFLSKAFRFREIATS